MAPLRALRSSAAGSLASQSHTLALSLGPATRDGSGPNAPESSERPNPGGAFLRTSQGCAPTVLTLSSPALPISGSMRNGSISARPTWAHRTDERGSSSSHTETDEGSTGTALPLSARWLWPTATASDSKRSAVTIGARQSKGLLTEAVVFHLVRTTRPVGASGSPGGFLNPSFVEALMGFPIGWSDLPRSETLLFLW